MLSDDSDDSVSGEDVVRLSADIAAAYVSNNSVSANDLPDVIRAIHGAVAGLSGGGVVEATAVERPKPAVSVARSVQHDHLVCLEDGKKLKMLKRYLRAKYDMTPDDYRRRWNLPTDYPMVAPAYAERRSAFAKQIGLGTGVRRAAAR